MSFLFVAEFNLYFFLRTWGWGKKVIIKILYRAKAYHCFCLPTCRIAWNGIVQMKEAFEDQLVQLPDYFKANQKLTRVIEGIIQMPLRHWQAWGTSRKPLPVLDHPHGKEIFPNIRFEPTLAQISAIPLCYILVGSHQLMGFLPLQDLNWKWSLVYFNKTVIIIYNY